MFQKKYPNLEKKVDRYGKNFKDQKFTSPLRSISNQNRRSDFEILILVPLVSVLYAIALSSFAIAAYYGFRLSRLTRKAKVMVMITKDGPTSLVGGLVLLAASQVPNLFASLMQIQLTADLFLVPSGVLLVGSAIMFAVGFQRMYAIYLNEKLKMSVNSVLDGLLEKEATLQDELR